MIRNDNLRSMMGIQLNYINTYIYMYIYSSWKIINITFVCVLDSFVGFVLLSIT